ncbi:hypothetical protein C2E21_6407 [Chlorella sorokiniana]|uniref:Uncharacterized protein n=1 Tax=Chlorella sorokiniana TaxID=3076 RepID=A0A2P6TLA3_CHLSO|nr:hypothetical protein C2E21_6407 [Chlorella sorokiniana]|eukprot:PRW45072.1 hypothetical protein C2E21_6407 [Chlorella sorokiniana]
MWKALFALAILLLAGLARAGRPDQELLGPTLSRVVARCIKKRDCLGRGWHSVCAKNSEDGAVGAFPNRCFMSCANKDEGVHWEALYNFKTSKHCIQNWQLDPDCSFCWEKRHGH